MNLNRILPVAVAATSLAIAGAAAAHGPGDKVVPKFAAAIPNIPGKSLIAVEVVSKVNDEPERVYQAGESFHEAPGSRHPVSRNASKARPAKLLAVFVVDSDDKELTVNDK